MRHLRTCIFDVDGVLLASPHERAWREALKSEADRRSFTTALYQAEVAGRPRLDGARATLIALSHEANDANVAAYAGRKQHALENLIATNRVSPFPDGIRFLLAIQALGWRLAVASSSKNANAMMSHITLEAGQTLLDAFSVNVCGRDIRHGKPDPELFLLAALELGLSPGNCVVVEDAGSGIKAARAAGMAALGIARLDDAAQLRAAGADLVVLSLDDVDVPELAYSRLSLVSRP